MIDLSPFCVAKRQKIDLSKRPTKVDRIYRSKDDYRDRLETEVRKLSDLQDTLYAQGRHAVLVIFQAMDAAGKDGVIKHVMSGINPQGCQVFSFKHPGPVELQHDFLWRCARDVPERGRIGVFNRSYYEEVLIARVHPEILHQEERIDPDLGLEKVFKGRYSSIRHFEKHLDRNGTKIVKIYLHLSFEEQRRRFLARIDEPDKNWKLSLADMHERRYWPNYMEAYEEAVAATSSHHAPWHVVPADDKENARLIVARILVEALEDLKLAPPTLTSDQLADLKAFRRELAAEGPI
jgi:PPK2 family polyphosphate:nucleotide phosphotransferase